MSKWEKVKLSELCSKIGSGATPRGGKEFYKESGIALFRSQNILDFSFSTDGLAFIDKLQAAQLENVIVQNNDVLINITGDSVARVCMTPEKYIPARVNQHVAIVRTNPQKADSYFILYYLQYIKKHLLSLASSGATRNALTKKMLEDIIINVPSIEEQRAIAATLSALDDKIALNTKINHHLEQMAQAIFKSWFVDFEPWGGVIPAGWQSGVLDDICGYNSERIAVDSLTKQTYISTENMLANKSEFVDAASLPTITHTTMFKIGDVLISNIRPYFKKIVYCTFSGGCSTDVLCFRPGKNMSFYLYCILFCDSFFEFMVAGSKGTKMPRGDKQQIMKYPIILPTDNILIDFSKIIEPILSQIAINKNENIRLAAIRDSLLPKLMSGEIEVK